LDQFSLPVNFGSGESRRNRARFPGRLGVLDEFLLIDSHDFGFGLEVNGSDLKPSPIFSM
jgi:hypothetical protein